ncbi:MAG: PAS domain S-box protein, partial [Chloroflexi bacterium]|nr:PAS domain S-box protein [Chloroflexota bacterium]
HLLKIVTFYFFYKAIIQTGFLQPIQLLFHDLKASETALRKSHNELEERVEQRTRELVGANAALQLEITERERAQQAFTDQQALLEAVFNQAADGILVYNAQGETTLINPAARRTLHLPPDGVLDLNPRNWGLAYDAAGKTVTPEDWPIRRALQYGETHTGVDLHITRPDGVYYDLLLSAAPVYTTGGDLLGAVGVFADITTLKAAENELRHAKDELERRVSERTAALERSNQLIETVLRVQPAATWVADAQGAMIRKNDMADRLWGGQAPLVEHIADYGVYQGWWSSSGLPLQPTDWPLARAIQAQTSILGDVIDIRRFDGSQATVLSSATPFFGPDGRLAGAIAVMQDITEQRRLEYQARQAAEEAQKQAGELKTALRARTIMQEALRHSEARLRRLVESNIIPIIFSSEEGTISEANQAFLTLVQYSRLELQNGLVRWPDLTPPEYAGLDSQAIDQARQRGACTPYEKELVRKDGRRISILVGSARLEGTQADFVSFILDLSELKAAEAAIAQYATQLERSNRELQEFAFVASHDLQEPLRKIQAFGDRLKDEMSSAITPTGLDYLERMQKAAVRMRNMINDLLSLSRVTTQARPYQRIELEDILQEVVSDLEVRIEYTQARVEWDDLPAIEADPPQMRQLFQNLIANALKFHRSGTAPVVRVHNGETGVRLNGTAMAVIQVEDNGIGFPQEYAERIFLPFQRLHGKDEYEGSGMGLAICRKIVERHNGTIRVRSAPGAGAVFIIQLPLEQQKMETSTAEK